MCRSRVLTVPSPLANWITSKRNSQYAATHTNDKDLKIDAFYRDRAKLGMFIAQPYKVLQVEGNSVPAPRKRRPSTRLKMHSCLGQLV